MNHTILHYLTIVKMFLNQPCDSPIGETSRIIRKIKGMWFRQLPLTSEIITLWLVMSLDNQQLHVSREDKPYSCEGITSSKIVTVDLIPVNVINKMSQKPSNT
jgi:hypothetical protein